MNEINTTIYGTLNGATALTSLLAGTTSIYHLQAPDNATLPYVIFNLQAGGNENLTPKERLNELHYIRGYSDNSAAEAGTIAAQVNNLLHKKTLSVEGWANFWCQREQRIELIENQPSGDKVWSEGAFYRIRLEQT